MFIGAMRFAGVRAVVTDGQLADSNLMVDAIFHIQSFLKPCR